MKSSRGFTVIELLFVVIILGVASVFFFIQKGDVEAAARDDQRKTAINAMYYGLEEVYYTESGSYPRSIDSKTLPSVDPDLFTDPNGVKLGESDSDYLYKATDCDGDACKSYTLRTTLEAEDDFVKKSRRE